MAAAGREDIAEVEELVPTGELDSNFIHTPSLYVQRIIRDKHYEKRVKRRTLKV